MLLGLENTAMHFVIQVTKIFIPKQRFVKKIRKSVMLIIYSYFSPPPPAGPTYALVFLNIE